MMSTQTVHVVVYKDAEDDIWLATCLEYGITTQGKSPEHAEEMIKEAVELSLEDRPPEDIEALFQPIDGEPTVTTMTINAPTLLHR